MVNWVYFKFKDGKIYEVAQIGDHLKYLLSGGDNLELQEIIQRAERLSKKRGMEEYIKKLVEDGYLEDMA